MSNNGLRPSQAVVHVRPIAEHAADAREIGFQMYYNHEPTLFEIRIRLEPLTQRAKEAIRRAADDATIDGIEVSSIYDKRRRAAVDAMRPVAPYLNEGERGRQIEITSQDAALYALGMARTALDQYEANSSRS